MLRIRNNLIDLSIVSHVIDDELGGYDFYGFDGVIQFTLDLNEAEFEVVAAYLGEEVVDEDKPTGFFSREAAA